jgi:ribosomal protein S18 acetylase RimI-like enzyme
MYTIIHAKSISDEPENRRNEIEELITSSFHIDYPNTEGELWYVTLEKEMISKVVACFLEEGELYNLCTHCDFRNQGIMYALLLEAKQYWFANGRNDIWLRVLVDNITAKNLYLKMGFIATEYSEHTKEVKMILAPQTNLNQLSML